MPTSCCRRLLNEEGEPVIASPPPSFDVLAGRVDDRSASYRRDPENRELILLESIGHGSLASSLEQQPQQGEHLLLGQELGVGVIGEEAPDPGQLRSLAEQLACQPKLKVSFPDEG